MKFYRLSIAQRVGATNAGIVQGSAIYHHHFLHLIVNKKGFMAT